MYIQKAFSLVELMVVIAIVAILAAAAVPLYKNHVIKARMAALMNLLPAVRNSILEEHNKGKVYGAADGITIYSIGGSNNPPYLNELKVGWYGCAILSFDLSQLGISYSGSNRLCMMECPFDNNGTITWVCQYHSGCNTQASVVAYLPQNCQDLYNNVANVDHDPNF